MASSDVIELGSSEDEAEPVPKKKKPTLNAMVHFPNEVSGLVIKPVKPVLPNLQKVLAGGAVTITNVKKSKVPIQVYKGKPNGRSGHIIVQRPQLKIPVLKNLTAMKPRVVNNLSVNPLSLMKNTQNTRVPTPKLSLPPGITIKRTATSQNIHNQPSILVGRSKSTLKRKPPEKIITTVELDDEEAPLTSGTSPQWYLRPEEQSKEVEVKENENKDKQDDIDLEKSDTLELENNKEPEAKNFIEITIEDSPIKPLQARKGFEVGSELPITIDDSPIKPLKTTKHQTSDSDIEKSNSQEPQSKKKLDYPKGDEDSDRAGPQRIVEIDLEMIPSIDESKEKSAESTGICSVDAKETKKDNENQKVDKPSVQTVLVTKEVQDNKSSEPNTEQKSDLGEFHPTYQKFIDLCFQLENSDDMVKIVEKKIKTYYRQCPKDYVESEEFIDMVSSKIFAMKAAPDKMYLYIKDIVDELNLQRKSAKAVEVSNKENKDTEGDKYFIADDGVYDTKRRRQIRKLDKTIRKLHRAIQKLEEQEVEFEDEEDSVYLLTERYKERLIRVHAKFCQLTNTKMPSEPRIQIDARPGFPTGPAKRLEKWVNRKVPIGTPLPFPDFHDVLRCVREANDEDKLGWNEADIMEEARDLFVRCGKKLQRRRQENEWRIAASRLSHDVSTLDPAEKSNDLKKKLQDNKTLAAKKEIELLNKYADKQNLLKLVGEEIGDKEAEESPVESEEDEGNDESNSLEDKTKRKERLKRLLHEKTMKMSSEKENITGEAKVNKDEKQLTKYEEKMESDAVSEQTESKNEFHEVINEAEINSNNTVISIAEDGPNNDQNKEKTNDFDLYDVDSDIDELHLLQKLYSENEINSSTQESDSDTPIAISDTLESDSDNEKVKIHETDDIISIENSSYSESEVVEDECDNAKVSDSVKEKKIDDLLLQNAEISLLPSALSDKMDVDEENILLAYSEEENDGDGNLHTNNAEESTNVIKLSNDGSANDDDCEVIFDNCNDNSMENDIEMYDILLDKGDNDKVNERIIPNNIENNILDNNQDLFKVNDIVSQQTNNLLKKDIEVDGSRNSLVCVDGSKDKAVRSESDNCVTSENCCENDTKTICKVDDYNCKENSIEKNAMNDQSSVDSVVLNVTSNKEISSEHHKNNCEDEFNPKIIDGNEENASNVIKNNSKEKDLT